MKRISALLVSLVMLLSVCLTASCTASDTPSDSVPTPIGTLPQENESVGGTEGTNQAPASDTSTPSVDTPTETTSSAPQTTESTAMQTTESTTSPLPPPPSSWNGYTRLSGTEDVNFNGETFVIAGYRGHDDGMDNANEIYSDGSTSVDLAVRERNQAIETLYNCTIEPYFSDRPVEVTSSYIRCGRDDIDLYAAKYAILNSTQNKDNHSFYSLGIDLSAEYWDQSFLQAYTAKLGSTSALLSITGDFSYHAFDLTQVILFNRDLYASVFGMSHDYADAYRLVRDGSWTVDTYLELMKQGEAGLSRSQAIGWARPRRALSSVYTAMDLTIIGNANGQFTYDVFQNVSEASRKLDTAITFWNHAQGTTASEQEARDAFTSGGALFLSDIVLSLGELSNAADFGIGVLPYPKADETQTEYSHAVHTGVVTYQVPITVRNITALGKFLEIYAAFSREIVRPAWIEMQAYEYCADPEAVEMLTLILDTRRYDPAHLIWTEYEQPITDMIVNQKNSISRHAERTVGDVMLDIGNFQNQTIQAHDYSQTTIRQSHREE